MARYRFRLTANSAIKQSVSDTFNRANQSPMSGSGLNMSDGLGVWVNGPGLDNACDIDSNDLFASNPVASVVVSTPTFGANQKSTVTLGSAGGSTLCGPSVRGNTSNCACYQILIGIPSTDLIVYKIDSAQGGTQIGSNFTVTALDIGDVISLEATGTTTTTLTIYINGVSQGSVTDSSSPITSGQPGIRFFNNKTMSAFSATEV